MREQNRRTRYSVEGPIAIAPHLQVKPIIILVCSSRVLSNPHRAAISLLLTACNDSQAPRYSVQPITVAGGLGALFQITDNEQNTVYLYKAEDDHLVLSGKFSLSEVGSHKIQMEKEPSKSE